MLALPLALSLCLAAAPSTPAQAVLVNVKLLGVDEGWQAPILSGVLEEVRSLGREAFAKRDLDELAANGGRCEGHECPEGVRKASAARLFLDLTITQIGTMGAVSGKVADIASAKILVAERARVEKASKDLYVEQVRKLARQLLEPLPPQLAPAPKPEAEQPDARVGKAPQLPASEILSVVVVVDPSVDAALEQGKPQPGRWLESRLVAAVRSVRGFEALLPGESKSRAAPRVLRASAVSGVDKVAVVLRLVDEDAQALLAKETRSMPAVQLESGLQAMVQALLASPGARAKLTP